MSGNATPEIVEVVFDVKGDKVPAGYAFALWDEVVRHLPWLAELPHAGIVPLKGSVAGEDILLSRRAKMSMRLPENFVEPALELTGRRLNIDSNWLEIGDAKARRLLPANTLSANMVASDLGEVEFLEEMGQQLRAMNIPCKLICSKEMTIQSGERKLHGYGLVLHELKPAASLQIQSVGLGDARRYGCGVFVHFKAITGLED